MDIPLSDKGREQAARDAKYIAKTYRVDRIYSSDLRRAHDTALPIANAFGLEIQTHQDLREIYPGGVARAFLYGTATKLSTDVWGLDRRYRKCHLSQRRIGETII